MYRIAIVVAVIVLGLAIERALIFENGTTADKPAAAKSDRQKIDVPPPPGLQDRADVKPPAAKADREKADREKIDHDKTEGEAAKQPPAKADRQEVTAPAVKTPPEEAKPPAAKADREEKKPPVAAAPPVPAAPKREAEKPPAVKGEREEKTPPVAAKVTPAPEQQTAVKPQRESKRRHAKPARHVSRAARRAYADVRQNGVRGNDAQVMQRTQGLAARACPQIRL